MATIPTYVTFVAGSVLTAAQLNTQVVNAGNFFLARPFFNGYNNATISCATGVYVLAPLDTEIEDNDNMHSTGTNPSRVICQTPGRFSVVATSGWATNSTGSRLIDLRLNAAGSNSGGTDLKAASAAASTVASNWQVSMTYSWRAVNIGDYIEMFVQQSSGGTLATGSGYVTMTAQWEIA